MNLAYRRVRDETKKRPVALIVICDACGNREIGWAWHDHGQVLWWPRHPYYSLTDARAKADAKLLHVRLHPRVLHEPTLLSARCLRHGELATPDAVAPADLSPEKTRRIRAFRSTAQ